MPNNSQIFSLPSVDAQGKPQSVEIHAEWTNEDGRSFGIVFDSPSLSAQNLNYDARGYTVRGAVDVEQIRYFFQQINYSLPAEHKIATPDSVLLKQIAAFINQQRESRA